MTKVSELSDIELNKKLSKLLDDDGLVYMYTDNWSMLMPLVEEQRFVISPFKEELWEVYDEDGEAAIVYNESLQRALAETLYLVLQEKNND